MTSLTKPVKRTTRTLDAVPYGVREEFAVTLYPGGLIGLREKGRRYEVQIGVGKLYAELVRRETLARKRAKARERRTR